MNDKIKALAERSMVIKGRVRAIDDEKFANLIIMECSTFLKDTLDDHFASEQLLEYFEEKA